MYLPIKMYNDQLLHFNKIYVMRNIVIVLSTKIIYILLKMNPFKMD